MKTLKAYHRYKLKNPKKSMHVNEIIPISDIEVKESFYDEYEEVIKNDVSQREVAKT